MPNLSDLRLSKNMKYTALYWAMRFSEISPDIFKKTYDSGDIILINAVKQEAIINDSIFVELNTHESFVKLELINRLLNLGYCVEDIRISKKDVIFNNFHINCIVWDDDLSDCKNMSANYKSRLISGVIEYKTKICLNNEYYDFGLVEKYEDFKYTKIVPNKFDDPNFIFEGNRVMKYVGRQKKVIIPEGITEIESTAFWDNQYIEEVILPSSLINLGGDTFYYCKNLRRVVIPKNVQNMGNNPFAGCPNIKIKNESPNYIFENGLLYTADKKTLIYCSIMGEESELDIPEGVAVISKHAFFCCDRFKKIILPSSLEKMENNPFSGCSKLDIICKTKAYFIKDDVIYNGFKTAVVGTLNKIKSDNLVLLDGIKTINRNSFWNCTGIKKIVFPKSLEDIGYNPFVGCSNIHFKSLSKKFIVNDDVLYNKDCSKIICYPAWKAVGKIELRDSVIQLERGAFSGCSELQGINLKNVNIINKSCFTNCCKLQNLYCSDLITYIGEWAFAYCDSLEEVSCFKNTIIDNNAFSNCKAKVVKRRELSNYLIESDNIYTLESMQKRYEGEIDSVLIDPPYNSHIDYIGYKDSGDEDDYLKFMRSRLSCAYKLMSNQGFLFINIDQGELNNLYSICVDLFGNDLVYKYKWKKKNPFFDKNRVVLNPSKIQTDFEYIIVCKKTHDAKLKQIHQPYIKNGAIKEKVANVPEVFDCFGTTSSAKDEIEELFGDRTYFSTPKPLKLLKEFVRSTTNKTSIVLDFFAGSGTTGHAVMDLNLEDDGKRKYIMISNDENNIFQQVTKKRINIAIDKFGYSDRFVVL